MRKHLKDEVTSLHISLLTLQPMTRNLNYNPKYEVCRSFVQVKWYNISDNIIEVMAFYRNKGRFLPSSTRDNEKELVDN